MAIDRSIQTLYGLQLCRPCLHSPISLSSLSPVISHVSCVRPAPPTTRHPPGHSLRAANSKCSAAGKPGQQVRQSPRQCLCDSLCCNHASTRTMWHMKRPQPYKQCRMTAIPQEGTLRLQMHMLAIFLPLPHMEAGASCQHTLSQACLPGIMVSSAAHAVAEQGHTKIIPNDHSVL